MTSNGSLRAGKSTLYEGGIREPLVVYWPDVTQPGRVCGTPVCSVDFYPTLAQAAGARSTPAQVVDGVSLVPLLRNPAAHLGRDTFYWHYPLDKPHFLGGRSAGAVRAENWKLIEFFDTGEVELYDLAEDPSERRNRAGERPEKKRELLETLHAWQRRVGATFPQGQPKAIG